MDKGILVSDNKTAEIKTKKYDLFIN